MDLVNAASFLVLAALAYELWLGPKWTYTLYDPESDRHSTLTGTRLAVWLMVRMFRRKGWEVTRQQGGRSS